MLRSRLQPLARFTLVLLLATWAGRSVAQEGPGQARPQQPAQGYRAPGAGHPPQSAAPPGNGIRIAQATGQARAPAAAPHGQFPPGQQPHGQAGLSQAGRGPSGPVPGGMPPQQAPFALTPQQQAELGQLLAAWQQATEGIDSFKCTFELIQYDKQFGPQQPVPPKNPNGAYKQGHGELKYKKPDHGMFRVAKVQAWGPSKENPAIPDWGEPEPGEHWVCDGNNLYEVDPTQKQIRIRPLPPHMRGQAIASGPLPFLFGANTQQLVQRFWMRIVTPPQHAQTHVWLEAWPRTPQDAGNFQTARLILSRQDLMPVALQVVQLNGNPWTYKFADIKINDKLAWLKRDFEAPRPGFGWKTVVINDQQNLQPPAQSQPGQMPQRVELAPTAPGQARREAPHAR